MTDKNSRFYTLPRTDGTAINPAAAVDLNSGCSYDPQSNPVVPLREPISRPSTLGPSGVAARVVGDMVAGQPILSDNAPTADLGPIAKLSDTKSQLPQRTGRLEP